MPGLCKKWILDLMDIDHKCKFKNHLQASDFSSYFDEIIPPYSVNQWVCVCVLSECLCRHKNSRNSLITIELNSN